VRVAIMDLLAAPEAYNVSLPVCRMALDVLTAYVYNVRRKRTAYVRKKRVTKCRRSNSPGSQGSSTS
jgi:hypothetical protein